jgi:hypothetical protein
MTVARPSPVVAIGKRARGLFLSSLRGAIATIRLRSATYGGFEAADLASPAEALRKSIGSMAPGFAKVGAQSA